MSVTDRQLKETTEALVEERERKPGPTPSTSELLAYADGRLADDASERVREYLSCHLDEARIVAELRAPGSIEVGKAELTPTDEAHDWQQIRERVAAPPSLRPVPSSQQPPVAPGTSRWLPAWAIAAAASVVLAVLATQQIGRRPQPIPDVHLVDLWQRHDTVNRGPARGRDVVPAGVDDFLLVLNPPRMADATRFRRYRIEVFANGERVLAESRLRGTDTGVWTILLSRRDLPPGEYRIFLSGLSEDSGDTAERVASYELTVE